MRARAPQVLLPLVVVGLALVGAGALVAARGSVETRPPGAPPPLVRVVEVAPRDVQLTVRAHGTVVPRTESDLVPEVSGRVVWVSPALAAGGFFEAGEPLLRLDRADYEIRLARAEAAAAGARSQARLARRTLGRSRELAAEGLVSRSALEDAETAERVAAAAEREAEAALEQARRDLERTTLAAPFAGRVREKQVDVGQFVERGRGVARLYAVDVAEVRLPVADSELAFLDLPLDYRDGAPAGAGPAVVLRARFAGDEHRWDGRIVRTEGEIDPRTRMLHAVARVEDPYGRGADARRPPLAVGLFVEAEIVGRTVAGAVVVPRAALREGARVVTVDADDRLRLRAVDVVRADRDRVVIRAGLAAGERVCVSPLEAVVEGMRVRPVAEPS